MGGADGHNHPAPVASALPRHRAPRRIAHRSRSATGHRLRGGAYGRRRCAPVRAGRPRSGRLSEDIRGRGIHVFLRIATDWDFVEVRRAALRWPGSRAPRTGCGDDVVVEGRTGRAYLHRLQPKRPRPHHGVGLFGASYPDRDGIDAVDLGRAGRRGSRRLHHDHGARAGEDPRRPLGRHGRRGPVDCTIAGLGRRRRGARAR